MSKDTTEIITDPTDWGFSIKDCEITSPVNPRTGKSFRFGASNGEHGLEGTPGREPDAGRASRRVVVTHVPTGITVVKDDYLPYRNKEIALKEVEKLVNEWIQKRSK